MESSEYEESDRIKLMRLRERASHIRLGFRRWAIMLSLACLVISLSPDRPSWIHIAACALASISLWWAYLGFNKKPRFWSLVATIGLSVLWLVCLVGFTARVIDGKVELYSFEGYTNVLLTIGVFSSAMSVIRSSELKLIEENREAWETYAEGRSLTHAPRKSARPAQES